MLSKGQVLRKSVALSTRWWFIQWNNWSQIYNNIIVCVKNAELRYCHEINVAQQQQSDFKTNIKRCPWPDPVRIISVILAGNVVKVSQKASLTVTPLPGRARCDLITCYVTEFRPKIQNMWKHILAILDCIYIFKPLSCSQKQDPFFFSLLLALEVLWNGSEVVCFAFLFRFPFFLNFINYWVLGGLFNPRTRLCSGNHQWLLAPNFCSQATRKSYFFSQKSYAGHPSLREHLFWLLFHPPPWISQVKSTGLLSVFLEHSLAVSIFPFLILASTEWRNQSVCMWPCQECSQGGRGVLCWIYLPNSNPVHAWSWKEPHTRTNWGANSDIPQEWHGFTDCWGKNIV